ncbi:MAG TPA: hypothetical protein VKA91_04485, partial [Nitrososphaeraceae archaeon]|nr:hypothetical protein [Nitrososphaeraceae archaeon]
QKRETTWLLKLVQSSFPHGILLECDKVQSYSTSRSLLSSYLNSPCSYAEYPDEKTESDLLERAKTFQDQTTYAQVTINGTAIDKFVYNLHRSISRFQKITFLEYHLAKHKPAYGLY